MLLKKLIPLLLFALYCTAFPYQQSDKLMKGNQLYRNSNFEGAIESYEKVLSSGFESSSLYYNLGNAYYRIGKIGYAILYYEKAHKLSPGDEDINHNLAFVNSKIPDRIETVPSLFLFRWWESLLALFSLNAWTYTVFILYILFLSLIAVYFLMKNPRYQRLSFFSGIGILTLLIFSVTILIINLKRELNYKNGVITEYSVAVKNAPDEKANDAFVIHEGLKVGLEDQIEGWIKIKLQDGKVGWINRKTVRVI